VALSEKLLSELAYKPKGQGSWFDSRPGALKGPFAELNFDEHKAEVLRIIL
jgi:hypothetical protein